MSFDSESEPELFALSPSLSSKNPLQSGLSIIPEETDIFTEKLDVFQPEACYTSFIAGIALSLAKQASRSDLFDCNVNSNNGNKSNRAKNEVPQVNVKSEMAKYELPSFHLQDGVYDLAIKVKEPETVINSAEFLNAATVPPVDPSKIRKQIREEKKLVDNAGPKWFGMKKPILTPQIKADLKMIALRGVLDPKHHYKKDTMSKMPEHFQIGRVIEGAADFHSRMTKKERKNTIVDEILENDKSRTYLKRRINAIHKKRTPDPIRKKFRNSFKKSSGLLRK